MTVTSLRNSKIISAVLCDDIRTEKNGKDILVGVYGGAIIVHEIPSPTLALRCWINIETRGPGNVTINFRAIDHNQAAFFHANVNIGTEEELGIGSVPLGPILYSLQDPDGSITVEYMERGNKWKSVITKTLKYQRREN